jgi:hypothetical protein
MRLHYGVGARHQYSLHDRQEVPNSYFAETNQADNEKLKNLTIEGRSNDRSLLYCATGQSYS